MNQQPEQRSRYSNWLRAGQLRDWSSSPGRGKSFSSLCRPDLFWALPPASYPEALYPVVKRPEPAADHSPPTTAQVKNTWLYTSTPLYVFMAWCLIS
jgi:hypothetical protein